MEIAVIGLGRMGANISRRLMRGGHRVIAYDVVRARVEMLVAEGATDAASVASSGAVSIC